MYGAVWGLIGNGDWGCIVANGGCMGANGMCGGCMRASGSYIITSGGSFRVDGGYIRAFLEKIEIFNVVMGWRREG